MAAHRKDRIFFKPGIANVIVEFSGWPKAEIEPITETVQYIDPKIFFNPFFADTYNELEEQEKAVELMEEFLKTDNSSAESFIILAKAYKGNEDNAKAKEALQKALDIWKDADERFVPFQEAQELMASLLDYLNK